MYFLHFSLIAALREYLSDSFIIVKVLGLLFCVWFSIIKISNCWGRTISLFWFFSDYFCIPFLVEKGNCLIALLLTIIYIWVLVVHLPFFWIRLDESWRSLFHKERGVLEIYRNHLLLLGALFNGNFSYCINVETSMLRLNIYIIFLSIASPISVVIFPCV